MPGLNELSLTELMRLRQAGELDVFSLYDSCLARTRLREPDVQAFEFLDENVVRSQLAALVSTAAPLHGIPFGVKDIIDTCDMPTTRGSPVYRGHQPVRDASCVALLRQAGALVFGKTVTTEFAFLNPGKTRNPHNLERTPGGSSQGSAAAVADCMVPFALGTQTAASVIRPAAFCGVVGYKASAGEFDLGDVSALSQTMDSLGFFTRDARDLLLLREACLGRAAPSYEEAPASVGFVRTPHWELTDQSTRAMFRWLLDLLDDSAVRVKEVETGPSDGSLSEAQLTVMAYESARSRLHEYRHHRSLLSPQILALIETGLTISRMDYDAALRLADHSRAQLTDLLTQVDFLIAPSTPGEAPGLETTGDPVFSRMWTVMGLPAINLPAAKGESGLPLGIQLVGAYRQDKLLIERAIWLQTLLSRQA